MVEGGVKLKKRCRHIDDTLINFQFGSIYEKKKKKIEVRKNSGGATTGQKIAKMSQNDENWCFSSFWLFFGYFFTPGSTPRIFIFLKKKNFPENYT